MIRIPKAITFDNFGTLIDWEGEIQAYFAALLLRKGIDQVDSRALQRRWEEIQFAYIQEQYRPYVQVLQETMALTFREFGLSFTQQDCAEFAASMGQWQPFPDSHEALLELKKFTKIVLITNTDNDIIRESVKQLDVEFDDIITAEMAGAYKPSYKGFHLARERLGLPIEDIMHAGFGFKYDMVPATELGYTTCWINRQGEPRPVDVRETYMVGDMKTFVYLLKGMMAANEGK